MNDKESIELLKTHNEKCSGCDKLCDDMCKPAVENAIKALEEIQQYRSIGTVEEFRAAVEKQRAKKPSVGNDNGRERKCCSICGCFYNPASRFCPKCGQHISWEHDAE